MLNMTLKKITKIIVVGTALLFLTSCSKTDNAASGSTQTPAVAAQQTYHWKLVTSWPKNFPGLGVAPERLATWVKEMSGGRLQIKVYGAGELVPALEVFDAVSRGTAEMGHSGAYYWKGKAPEAQFFSSVPFGLNAQEMNAWLHCGGGLELWQEVYEPFGLIPLAGGNSGVQMAGWFNKEINSIEDIKGLKMRIPGLGGEVMTRLGALTENLPGGEIFTALQTGRIDATEWVGPYNDLAFGLNKAAKFYYYPGWHEPGTTMELTVNKKSFDALPKDLQTILTVAARAVNQDMLDEYTAKNNAALKQLMENSDIQLRPLPTDVLEKLKEVSDQVVLELSETNPNAKRIYKSFNEFRSNVIDYHKISEQAFINARQTP